MITLWTSDRKSIVKIRRLFRLNLFKLNRPKSHQLQDILTVMSPVKGNPNRISVFGISLHLSELTSEEGMNYETLHWQLSQMPEGERSIATPDFMKSCHGLICLEGTRFKDRVAMALQKRLGRPVFIITPLPLRHDYSLEYRFSPRLSSEADSQQFENIEQIKRQYGFNTALKSRVKFKSVIQEVILNGVPKL